MRSRAPPLISATPAARRLARRHAFDALKGLAMVARVDTTENGRAAERSLLSALARIGQAAEQGTPDERADGVATLRQWRAWRRTVRCQW